MTGVRLNERHNSHCIYKGKANMRDILSSANLHVSIKKQVENYHTAIVKEVANTITKNRVVVVGMKYNYSVYNARRALKKSDIAYTYLEYGSYFSQWRKRLALKMWTGWPTFPMMFVDGKLVGGNKDLNLIIKENPKLSQLNN